ncbi:hypothetical protein BC939DRAFT_454233, partial [Gamsiella multidivaricata]|uniref:uncharacterized protein n=1 Tax=Gamsiella multidivaricata TaxID=101098 RepID=UPI00221FE709
FFFFFFSVCASRFSWPRTIMLRADLYSYQSPSLSQLVTKPFSSFLSFLWFRRMTCQPSSSKYNQVSLTISSTVLCDT